MQKFQPTVRFSTSAGHVSQPRRGPREVRVGCIRHRDFLAMAIGGQNQTPITMQVVRDRVSQVQVSQDAASELMEDDCRKPRRLPLSVQTEFPEPDGWDLDHWLPELAPSPSLAGWYAIDEVKWSEFTRRYRQELGQQAELCEDLRQLATERELVLVHDSDDADRSVAAALETHVQFVECQRRWQAGWVIGGHTWPMRHQLKALGGLWYPPHKVWAMPDQTTCQAARRLFPGDF